MTAKYLVLLAITCLSILVYFFGFASPNQPTVYPENNLQLQESRTGKISGRVLKKSDIMFRPDRPALAVVLVIPELKMPALYRDVGFEEDPQLGRSRLFFIISDTLFSDYVSMHTVAKKTGHYELDVLPESYALCLANIDKTEPDDLFPARLYGCTSVTVGEAERVKQNLYWGEGGMTTR